MGRPSGFKTEEGRRAYVRLYDEAVALSPVPVVESDVATSFGATHVVTAGDLSKPPLVALHAKAMSATMWVPLLPTLTATHHVRLIDAVGDVNKSVATDVLSSPARLVSWIDEVLDALWIERSAFVGASMGAWMATRYALARPDRVDRLALLGPAGIVSRQHTKWVLGMIGKLAIRPTPSKTGEMLDSMAMERTLPRLRADPWRPIARQFIEGLPAFRANMREPRPGTFGIDALRATPIPVLALIGRQETLHDGAQMAERFRAQLPDAQVELVDDANHLVFIDQPDIVAARLGGFLSGGT
jgi:pimeloyl-ACP methyl ester carboxylesterase